MAFDPLARLYYCCSVRCLVLVDLNLVHVICAGGAEWLPKMPLLPDDILVHVGLAPAAD